MGVLAASLFGLGLGEELWRRYIPRYLRALGASSVVVGLFASYEDLLDGLYQYPGGWVNDRFGRKQALMLFTGGAIAGYAVYALAFHWAVLFAGVTLVMAWKSGAFPTTFAIVGDSLPQGKRAIAFSVQSILVRLPRVIGAPVGGLLIAWLGTRAGIRVALGATILLALGVLVTQQRGYQEKPNAAQEYARQPVRQTFRDMPAALKSLLWSDVLARLCESISQAFIVLYVMEVLRFSAPAYGALYAIQMATAITLYLPAGKIADRTGRRLLVALTFMFFALHPLAVRIAHSFVALVGAFVVGGLREIGEPARKSVIVDHLDASQRGRAVGVYYTIRNLLVVPGGAIGGLLWRIKPAITLETAFAIGAVGTLTYLATSRRGERYEMDHA